MKKTVIAILIGMLSSNVVASEGRYKIIVAGSNLIEQTIIKFDSETGQSWLMEVIKKGTDTPFVRWIPIKQENKVQELPPSLRKNNEEAK